MEKRANKNIIEELKCIWMSANFVGEKLCNNNFDCDNCSFEKEMRKSRVQKERIDSIYAYTEQNLLEDVIDKLISLKNSVYPSLFYFNNCFVIKKFFGDTYFLGFNPMINVILDNVTNSSILGQNQVYHKDEKFIKIEGDWGSVDINAPFEFTLESEVLPVTLKPQSGKWIGFIKSENEKFDSVKITREDFLKSVDGVCSNLRKHMKKFVTVGATMYDGGERLKYIYQVIGKENYIKLLLLVLT